MAEIKENPKNAVQKKVEKKEKKETKEIEKLLERTHVQKQEKPKKKPKKKNGRGRPRKKKKPTYTKEKYQDQPLAVILNRVTCGIVNKTVLKDCEKLEEDEIELGEALVYTIEYYADFLKDHPAMVWLGAGIGAGLTIYDKTQTKKPKTKEHEKEDKALKE